MDYNIASERAYNTPAQNSTLLPMLLMSLASAMSNSPKTSQKFKEYEYDYVIVGGGTAGSALASRLSEMPCVTVLLLEAGSTPPLLTEVPAYGPSFWGSDIDWGYQTVPQKHTAWAYENESVALPRGKTIGGTSIFNHMEYIRGNKKDYDGWKEMGAKEWSFNKILKYFIKAEDNTNQEFLDNGYHGRGGPVGVQDLTYHTFLDRPFNKALGKYGYEMTDSNGPHQTGISVIQVTQRNSQRCAAGKAYLIPAENRTNLDIHTNTFVKKIIIEDGRARGVIFDDSNGVELSVTAKQEVILSAGVFNSAQLLMLSGIGPKEQLEEYDIPVIVDLPVGENYQDHCAPAVFFTRNPAYPDYNKELGDDRKIKEYINRRTGPLASMTPGPVAFLKAVQSRPHVPDIQFIMNEFGVESLKKGLKQNFYDQAFKPYENTPSITCLAFVLHPRSRGTVTLRSKDPYDLLSVDPNYLADKHDLRMAIKGIKYCYEIANSHEMRHLDVKPFNTTYPGCEAFTKNNDEKFECMAKSYIQSFNHPVGTVKMGSITDKTTVVTPQLRVKGVHGLRVVDASVMPRITTGNTMAPVYMIAEKAADMIKRNIHCE